ncbi:MAG: leucine--tRNA ligase [Chloroflexi bacterium]|nr:leucine--tRNA ligase [Chloroflexota bacterium]|tara:strand:+ start:991 stop:3474 length:2484 start_codon:yes stop_codon:yes gene_type:complete
MTTPNNRTVKLRWNPNFIDAKWQNQWTIDGLNKVDDNDSKPKWYELTMYPYPSGDTHIGHWYAMAPADAHARFRRMQGYNVLHPMGFDAFGLPAENAAIKRGVHPRSWTMANIEKMRKQLKSMGTIYDWDREIICALPNYYKWNQWLFLKLYEAGLAYRSDAPAVWCPSCQTVLANEQVIEGQCERCGTPIVRRKLNQWFLGITEYADELLESSENLDWPDRIITMQKNWIGRNEGTEVSFDISHMGINEKDIKVFTTRPDTLYGVTFMVLAPEHPLLPLLTTKENKIAVTSYVEKAINRSDIERLSTDQEKSGVALGSYCINRINNEKIPIFTSDYVVSWYATGAVMGVPAHDQRDFEFATKFNIPIKQVISPEKSFSQTKELPEAFVGSGFLINSEQFNGEENTNAQQSITSFLSSAGWGKSTRTYRIRDWLISRQRYWGTPIPIIHCSNCGLVPVEEDKLPVLLPENAEFKPSGESPLARHEEFRNTECPSCSTPAYRETDTMDTFFDSSWYFLRYTSSQLDTASWDPEKVKKWLPVDQYTGGAEHAVMHLLYARFFIKALRDIGLLSIDEPFLRLFNQGHIIADGTKMSKSRGNVVNPDPYVEELGADVVRTYLMFVGPWEGGGEWNDSGINGIARWLNRIWELVTHDPKPNIETQKLPKVDELIQRRLHQTIRKVHNDLDSFKFNTAIAALMEFSNDLQEIRKTKNYDPKTWINTCKTFLIMLSPIAPHITEELWEILGEKNSIHKQLFPSWNDSIAEENQIPLIVQINGKMRDRIIVPSGIDEKEAEKTALESPNVQRHLEGNSINKIVYVQNKIINIVVS